MIRHILLASAALLPAAAFAQGAGHTGTAGADSFHDEPGRDIVITAALRGSRADLLSGVTVLSADDLARELRPTIGDTLARQPGVSSTSFGPNASRPILRGLQGDRIRVLTDGIGSIDASTTSVDHAVAINPLTADRIEILRGPAALLFGSSAIGGVVNVIDRRIPYEMPDEDFHLDGVATYGSAADERSGAASIDLPAGSTIVLHADGSYAKTGDLRTGGFLLSAPLRAAAAVSDNPEIRERADERGRLDNSASRTWDVAGGASIVTDRGTLGISVSRYDSRYGVPSRLSLTEHEHEEGEDHDHDEEGHGHDGVTLRLRQTRADLKGDVETGGGLFERIRVRAGFADYRHDEIEPSGEIGTSFFNEGMEGRVELVQQRRGAWRGVTGGQMFVRDFRVIGEEKFVPRNTTEQFGLFTLQQFDLGALRLEGGARYERSTLTAAADADLGTPDLRRSFDAVSASAGATFIIADGWRTGLNLSRSVRAPSAEELFANGPHIGTQAFEIGDPDFAKEKSWSAEATLRGRGDGWSFEASAYHSWFRDFIYETVTGEERDELPVFQYAQADARYYGFEVEGSARLATIGGFGIVADGLADYVRARIVGAGPAPRIPPLRLLGGIEAQSPRLTARGEVEHAFSQDRVTAFETTTPGYTMVNASIAWKPIAGNSGTTISLSANNIFDVVARRHASFLKDYAPLAGRDIRVSARLSF